MRCGLGDPNLAFFSPTVRISKPVSVHQIPISVLCWQRLGSIALRPGLSASDQGPTAPGEGCQNAARGIVTDGRDRNVGSGSAASRARPEGAPLSARLVTLLIFFPFDSQVAKTSAEHQRLSAVWRPPSALAVVNRNLKPLRPCRLPSLTHEHL
jgi:hypothetical protein